MKYIGLFAIGLCLSFEARANTKAENVDLTAPNAFEREARREAARQGWEGYPEVYQDAFYYGALWANRRKKTFTCSDVFEN